MEFNYEKNDMTVYLKSIIQIKGYKSFNSFARIVHEKTGISKSTITNALNDGITGRTSLNLIMAISYVLKVPVEILFTQNQEYLDNLLAPKSKSYDDCEEFSKLEIEKKSLLEFKKTLIRRELEIIEKECAILNKEQALIEKEISLLKI